MKIVSLTAENIKKLKVVEITPTGSVVQITGPNGSGKSSVLDCIFMALGGTKAVPSEPIRKGQEKARIVLNMGTVIVTRKFNAAGTTLTVEGEKGARFPSPQKMLDELLGALAFDPLEFSRMEPRQQLDTLRRLVKLDVDVDELDALNRADYETRTGVNRRVKELQAQVDAIQVSPNLPAEAVDVTALTDELAAAGEQNVLLERQRSARADGDRAFREAEEALTEAGRVVDELKVQLADSEKRLAHERARLEGLRDARAKIEPLPEPVDTIDLRRRIDAAAEVNRAVDLREGKKALREKLRVEEDSSQAITRAMDERTALKQKTIEAAAMPVPGLGFGDGFITYGGLPFDQASSAEQLRVSVAIAMAANPQLRVLRIKDGSLLDEKNLALIGEMAQAGDYQVWIERVDTSGKVGIVMEDGEVKEEHQ